MTSETKLAKEELRLSKKSLELTILEFELTGTNRILETALHNIVRYDTNKNLLAFWFSDCRSIAIKAFQEVEKLKQDIKDAVKL